MKRTQNPDNMKTNKKQIEKLAETIIGKLVYLQSVSGGSIRLQNATREIREFINQEVK